MSKITNDGLTPSGKLCFTAVLTMMLLYNDLVKKELKIIQTISSN